MADLDPKYKRIWAMLFEQLGAMKAKLPAGQRPLLVLPGIMGSELQAHDSKVLWVALRTLRVLDSLRFADYSSAGGKNLSGKLIHPMGPTHIPFVGDTAYKAILAKSNALFYPYDWRESLEIEGARLITFLSLVKDQKLLGGDGKIDVVTHSMGGLLMMAALGPASGVDDILHSVTFTVPPFRGAVDILDVLANGNAVNETKLDSLLPIKQVARSCPGVFQLLLNNKSAFDELQGIGFFPAQEYPIEGFGGAEAGPGAEDTLDESLLKWNPFPDPDPTLRRKVLDTARAFRTNMAGFRTAVPKRLKEKNVLVNVIVGLGGPTLNRAFMESGRWVCTPQRGSKGSIFPGDGRVLLQSAFLPEVGMANHFAFVEPNRKAVHGAILMQQQVLKALDEITSGRAVTGLRHLSTFQQDLMWLDPPAVDTDDDGARRLRRRMEPIGDISNHLLRAAARLRTNPREWAEEKLNPIVEKIVDSVGKALNDDEVFALTNAAVTDLLDSLDDKVSDLEQEKLLLEKMAKKYNVPTEFIKTRIQNLLQPLL